MQAREEHHTLYGNSPEVRIANLLYEEGVNARYVRRFDAEQETEQDRGTLAAINRVAERFQPSVELPEQLVSSPIILQQIEGLVGRENLNQVLGYLGDLASGGTVPQNDENARHALRIQRMFSDHNVPLRMLFERHMMSQTEATVALFLGRGAAERHGEEFLVTRIAEVPGADAEQIGRQLSVLEQTPNAEMDSTDINVIVAQELFASGVRMSQIEEYDQLSIQEQVNVDANIRNARLQIVPRNERIVNAINSAAEEQSCDVAEVNRYLSRLVRNDQTTRTGDGELREASNDSERLAIAIYNRLLQTDINPRALYEQSHERGRERAILDTIAAVEVEHREERDA